MELMGRDMRNSFFVENLEVKCIGVVEIGGDVVECWWAGDIVESVVIDRGRIGEGFGEDDREFRLGD